MQDTLVLRKLIDKIECQIRNLEILDVRKDIFGNLLIPIILYRIPNDFVLEYNIKWQIYGHTYNSR